MKKPTQEQMQAAERLMSNQNSPEYFNFMKVRGWFVELGKEIYDKWGTAEGLQECGKCQGKKDLIDLILSVLTPERAGTPTNGMAHHVRAKMETPELGPEKGYRRNGSPQRR